jgi:hypothetical protein
MTHQQRRAALNRSPLTQGLWLLIFLAAAVVAFMNLRTLFTALFGPPLSDLEALGGPFYLFAATYSAVLLWLIYRLTWFGLALLAVGLIPIAHTYWGLFGFLLTFGYLYVLKTIDRLAKMQARSLRARR